MRKQECVHLHALLVEVTRYLVEHDELEAAALARYDHFGTRPSSIHESKQNHRQAISLLVSALDRQVESPVEEAPDHHLVE